MKLTLGERGDPADKPALSVHPQQDVDAAWDAEIAHRIRQIDSGEVECLPWELVIAELGKTLPDATG